VPTDDRSVDEVVAADANLALSRGRLSAVRFQARRVSVAARHIRL